jgi:hypothetical protein
MRVAMNDRRHGSPRERGTVLALVLVLTVLIGTLLVASISTTMLQARTLRYATDSLEAQGLAEGATEVAQKELIDTVASFGTPPTSGYVTIGDDKVLWTATPIGPTVVRTDVDGVRMTAQPYDVSSRVDIDSGTSSVTRVLDLTQTPIFQYMIFYDDDLEILPGAGMTLRGRVHTNGDVYLGTDATLTVDADYFQATGEILRRRKSDGTPTGGTVLLKEYQGTDLLPLAPNADSSAPGWEQNALNTWGGSVKTGDHGVREIATPSLQTLQPGGFYAQQAGLRIVNTTAYNSLGLPVLLPAGTISQKTLYDARERKTVTVTDIDIGRLNTSGAFPMNGLIYAHRTDATPSQPNGIRLKNGAQLLAPLTVVSENPVYIQGNYNTVAKKGASVITDAVNLLSNAWNDTKRAGTLPNASDTTWNFAMVTGNVRTPDGGGNYSGGFENLPRFHENWTGRTATILGAFVNMYESSFGRTPWRYGGDVYTAPTRNWAHDPDFLDASKLPPFTPNAVYVRRVLWDDKKPVEFKYQDDRLSLLPATEPVYDPFAYDATYLEKVIVDPNLVKSR